MPLSACREPMCPDFGVIRGRCELHAKTYRQRTRKATAGASMYGTKRWKAARRKCLSRDRYTCQDCRRFGNEVDHVVPLAQGGLPFALNNLQTLCKPCHSRKTAKEVWE